MDKKKEITVVYEFITVDEEAVYIREENYTTNYY